MTYDQHGVEDASRALLEAVGEDITREGLRDTPSRMGRAWRELLSGLEEDPRDHLKTTFEVGTDEIVMVRDIRARGLHPQGRPRDRAFEARARRRGLRSSSPGPRAPHRADRGCD